MAPKVHKIHSLRDDAPWDKGVPPTGSAEHPMMVRGLDRVLSIQRPLVLAHIRSIRLRNPQASPAEIIRILERRYLAAVPPVEPRSARPLSSRASARVSRSHSPAWRRSASWSPQLCSRSRSPRCMGSRSRTGSRQSAGDDADARQGGRRPGRTARRAGGRARREQVVVLGRARHEVTPPRRRRTSRRPAQSMFVKQVRCKGGASVIGKALPFGIGAAIGGAGNNILGRRVLTTSHKAFGAAPIDLPLELEPVPGAEKLELRVLRGARYAGNAVAGAAGTTVRGVEWRDARPARSAAAPRPTRNSSPVSPRAERTSPKDRPTRCGEHPTAGGERR